MVFYYYDYYYGYYTSFLVPNKSITYGCAVFSVVLHDAHYYSSYYYTYTY